MAEPEVPYGATHRGRLLGQLALVEWSQSPGSAVVQAVQFSREHSEVTVDSRTFVFGRYDDLETIESHLAKAATVNRVRPEAWRTYPEGSSTWALWTTLLYELALLERDLEIQAPGLVYARVERHEDTAIVVGDRDGRIERLTVPLLESPFGAAVDLANLFL